MEKFRDELNKKIKTYKFLLVLMALMPMNLRLLQRINIFSGARDDSMLSGILIGFHVGFILVLAIIIIRLSKSLHDEKSLKKYYAFITDERTMLIKTKSAIPLNIVNAYFIMLIGYLLQSFNEYITYSCIVTAFLLLLQTIFLKIYYMRKM